MSVSELRVLWEHPETHEVIEIGTLGYDGTNYSFEYTREAEQMQRLPLMGLPVGRAYRRPELPAVFAQRVMRSRRRGYTAYMWSLGLDPETATSWDQLCASGGKRVGDKLRLEPVTMRSAS